MDKSLKKTINKLERSIDEQIIIIKGRGGFRYRAKFKLSDVEFDQVYDEAISKIHILGIGIAVAEQMMVEPSPSIHSRWDEYNRRVRAAVAELGKK